MQHVFIFNSISSAKTSLSNILIVTFYKSIGMDSRVKGYYFTKLGGGFAEAFIVP